MEDIESGERFVSLFLKRQIFTSSRSVTHFPNSDVPASLGLSMARRSSLPSCALNQMAGDREGREGKREFIRGRIHGNTVLWICLKVGRAWASVAQHAVISWMYGCGQSGLMLGRIPCCTSATNCPRSVMP